MYWKLELKSPALTVLNLIETIYKSGHQFAIESEGFKTERLMLRGNIIIS